ncbi:MAG: aminopeptidase P N-terminal domain-containing protein [Acidobacteria bacterium]|nr:aminopeptidase P N-terminal domain-containing protein [Acidobacteriota bacterium]
MKKYFALLSLVSIFITVPIVPARGLTPDTPAPKAIIQTPPAPQFSDAERQQELAERRARVYAEMKDDSVMILFSATPKVYTNDVDFLYRQENDLYYLTNLKQKDATLVMSKTGSKTQEFLFLPKRDPQNETWNGHMYSPAEAADISGVKTILDASEFENFFNLLKNKRPYSANGFSFTPAAVNLYLLTPSIGYETEDTREYQREWELAKSLSKPEIGGDINPVVYQKTGSYQIVSAFPIFEKLRLVKTPYEIKLIQHAIDISVEAHMRAMATAGQVKWEYETQAEIEYVFRRRNADYWGYPSIVGCGPNATTLHYEESQGAVKPGDLLLQDVGAEYEHLTADVTRTFPVSGKFTKEQAEIYRIVYDAQEAAAKTIKPGARFGEPAQAARQTIEAGLARLGLITAPGAFIPGTNRVPQFFLWYMHGWGHWLGMNVHDVGGGGATVLKPGMIMTNEPGIYIREDALDYLPDNPETKAWLEKIRPVYEKYKNIGVRIEDDMLVTPTGVEWMTGKLPRKLEDIESFMASAANEIKVSRNENGPKTPDNIINNLAYRRIGGFDRTR